MEDIKKRKSNLFGFWMTFSHLILYFPRSNFVPKFESN